VEHPDLVEPLCDVGRRRTETLQASFVMLVHDWSKLIFFTSPKEDMVQLMHEDDVGYELTREGVQTASHFFAPPDQRPTQRQTTLSGLKHLPTLRYNQPCGCRCAGSFEDGNTRHRIVLASGRCRLTCGWCPAD